nr:hypothetical protein [uncultured Campylobacter sp.]
MLNNLNFSAPCESGGSKFYLGCLNYDEKNKRCMCAATDIGRLKICKDYRKAVYGVLADFEKSEISQENSLDLIMKKL